MRSQTQRFALIAMAAIALSNLATAEDDPFIGMERTFQRLPEHEVLAAEILGLVGLKSDIRVYLDIHNPAFCGRSDVNLRAIILSDWCSRNLYIDARYNWFAVEKLAAQIGHVNAD